MKTIQTIDQVISALDKIISESENSNQPLGYFAALYRKVTIKVKEGIKEDFFDDGPRMEKLDVIFANRYLDAYFAWKDHKTCTNSWQKTFEISKDYWPIVLQHLLLGMNAHINLDLGIAAAEVTKDSNIDDLENDFNKINQILSSLVIEVQNDLSNIWPTLAKILRKTKKVDDLVVDFSMELARDGAWKFAKQLASLKEINFQGAIIERDKKIAQKVNLILGPGLMAKVILKIIRLGERGTIKERIRHLAN